jgi:hypothetical protein
MKMEDGFSYTGGWVSGEMSGKGIAVYANGDQYDGFFLNGKREGKGVMTFQDGKVIDTIWKAGKEIKRDESKTTPSN